MKNSTVLKENVQKHWKKLISLTKRGERPALKAVPCAECGIYYSPVQCKSLACPVCTHEHAVGNLLLDMRRDVALIQKPRTAALREPEVHAEVDTHA